MVRDLRTPKNLPDSHRRQLVFLGEFGMVVARKFGNNFFVPVFAFLFALI